MRPKQFLPIGIQSFRKLRTTNCIYVDKTEAIYDIISHHGSYFLSRPRRFGKSLLLSTIKEIFLGNKMFFKDLWIENNWDWIETNPVIHISFAALGYETLGLEEAIRYELKSLYEKYNFVPKSEDIKLLFKELIINLSNTQNKVVLLIDEYDKPIIDFLGKEEIHKAKENRAILKQFYSALKDCDEYLRFLLITGVSKFTQVSIFSDLNNLDDLTVKPSFATALGYTHAEIERYFEEYLQKVLRYNPEHTRERILLEMQEWYNGYSWDGIHRVYNPFGTMRFLDSGMFRNYWFETGSPTFLIKKIMEDGIFYVENFRTTLNILSKYDLENLSTTSLMFQTGYLTIKEKHKDGFILLDYPNREVRESMYQFLVVDMSRQASHLSGVSALDLVYAFNNNDLQHVQKILISLFSQLPYDTYSNQQEGFYHGLLHLVFNLMGLYIQSEVHTSNGRADCIIHTPQNIYILEFKYNLSSKAAMEQIKDRKYFNPYLASEKNIILIGANFDGEKREFDAWMIEQLVK